jgi:hypothetical protein
MDSNEFNPHWSILMDVDEYLFVSMLLKIKNPTQRNDYGARMLSPK